MEYPKLESVPYQASEELITALGIHTIESQFYCEDLQSVFIELKSEKELKQTPPNFELLMNSSTVIKEVVVMSKAESQRYDLVLRSFCPWIGIDEDPVTGSVHSVLGRYWSNRLRKDQLVVFQASERAVSFL